MLVENQKVIVKWGNLNKKRLESLGYIYTGIGTEVEIDIADLSHGSKVYVEVICDYDGTKYKTRYKDYNRNHIEGKDCCPCCVHTKICETNIQKYGGKSPSCSQEVLEKQKRTLTEKYGTSNLMQVPEIKKKMQDTCNERYGTYCPSKNLEVQEKIVKTCMEKYGGRSSQCDPNIRKKTIGSMIKNGKIPTSKQELSMVELIKKMYGQNNCIPQFILDKSSFDCLLVVDGINIDVEYDGNYWHKDRHKDIKRDLYANSKGYKVLRFKSDYNVPTEEQIRYGVNYLVNSEHYHLIIDI